jgi:general secretion pathway protein G
MHPLNPQDRSRRSAFTLIEVIIVIGLLIVLVSLTVPAVNGILEGNQTNVAQTWVKSTGKMALTRYRVDMGSFPSTEQGLRALVEPPSGAGARWEGPYLEELPKDPFGEPYQYRYPAQKSRAGFDLWSKGPDRESGTSDDVGNWSTDE